MKKTLKTKALLLRVHGYSLREISEILKIYHDREKLLSFWSKVMGICKNQFSVYNKAHTGNNKKKGYRGCLSIRYHDIRILKEIFIIIKRMSKLI